MRYVLLKDIEPGIALDKSLYSETGQILIGKGVILTQSYIERLEKYGIFGIYIYDRLSEDIEVEEAISPETRALGMKCINEGDIDGCLNVAKKIVDEILEKGKVTLDMNDLKTYDNYTYAHSVNVAVYSCVLAMGMGLSEQDMENLVLAGILHDLGKMLVPPEILNKPGRLTPGEFSVMKNHAQLSYDLIKDNWNISGKVKEAVLSHHENVDGSGYPNGTEGKKQSVYTKILHVADVYDALISKRSYKVPYSPYEAAEYMMGGCGIMFDRKTVDALLRYVPMYPKGTTVILSDGRKGIIVENTGVHNLRPIVRLMDFTTIDLSELSNMHLTLKSEIEFVEATDIIKSEEEREEMLKEVTRFRILAVDDMKSNLSMLRDILEDKYDLSFAKSGEQAIYYLKKNTYPDLILMDIDMPEMDGIETAKIIMQMTSNTVPILFVTAVSDIETVKICKQLGAAGYILRPYKATYIRSEIRHILEGIEEI